MFDEMFEGFRKAFRKIEMMAYLEEKRDELFEELEDAKAKEDEKEIEAISGAIERLNSSIAEIFIGYGKDAYRKGAFRKG